MQLKHMATIASKSMACNSAGKRNQKGRITPHPKNLNKPGHKSATDDPMHPLPDILLLAPQVALNQNISSRRDKDLKSIIKAMGS